MLKTDVSIKYFRIYKVKKKQTKKVVKQYKQYYLNKKINKLIH